MWRFILGITAGYLTFTENGKKFTEELMNKGKKEVKSFLKKEGVIEDEQTPDVGPFKPSDTSTKHKEQHCPDETVDK